MADIASPLMTAKEAMAYLRKSRAWLTRHADEVGCVRDGGRLYFRLTRLDDWIARHEVVPPAAIEDTRRGRSGVRRAPTAGLGPTNPVTGLPWGALG